MQKNNISRTNIRKKQMCEWFINQSVAAKEVCKEKGILSETVSIKDNVRYVITIWSIDC